MLSGRAPHGIPRPVWPRHIKQVGALSVEILDQVRVGCIWDLSNKVYSEFLNTLRCYAGHSYTGRLPMSELALPHMEGSFVEKNMALLGSLV